MQVAALDSIDTKILEVMQRDASLSTAQIAEKAGLSQSPCWRRIQRLRDEGYIRATVVLVDRKLLGFEIQIYAQVKMNRLNEEERAQFMRTIKSTPEIVECHTILGEMDTLIKVLAPSMSWYQEFIFNTVMKLPGVTDVRSIMTISELKSTTSVPVRQRQYR
jgi:Lrp/AsnC family transcriptional regulator